MLCLRGRKTGCFPIVIGCVMADITLIFDEKELVDLKFTAFISVNHYNNYEFENYTFSEHVEHIDTSVHDNIINLHYIFVFDQS